jgi:hypothetical protein
MENVYIVANQLIASCNEALQSVKRERCANYDCIVSIVYEYYPLSLRVAAANLSVNERGLLNVVCNCIDWLSTAEYEMNSLHDSDAIARILEIAANDVNNYCERVYFAE